MAVKLILRESVEHLGERGEIVSVAPGYARNFLLPKGLALEATPAFHELNRAVVGPATHPDCRQRSE